jgi:hypothetical protein
MESKHNKKIIFISWTNFSSHSKLLAQAVDAPIFYVKDISRSRNFLWKMFFWLDYLSKSFRTLQILLKEKPNSVFVQNPPSIAPILVILFRKLVSYRVLVDSHNGAFEKKWFNFPLHKWALRNADVVTVHNRQLYEKLVKDKTLKGVNFNILNSRLTDFSYIRKESQKEPYIFVVNTFSVDEPIEIVLEGIVEYCSGHNTEIIFKVSGNYEKHPAIYSKFSKHKNIEFVGFVPESMYEYLLVNSLAVMSLSTRDDVQQFALSEAVGAEVPFISNNNSTNRYLFGDKMVLTELQPVSISAGIDTFINNKKRFDSNILEIKKTISEKWQNDFVKVRSALSFD